MELLKDRVVLVSGGTQGAGAARQGATVVVTGRRHDYDGWWVLEQDTILEREPVGEGPVADVRRSADRLREILA